MHFTRPENLPKLMVAPNGARRTKQDHPAIPVTLEETFATAQKCYAAGAESIHFHLRDADQQHLLDAGLYKEGLAELHRLLPEMHLQITTEAVGRYSPEEMTKIAYEVMPPGISIGLAELMPDRQPGAENIRLYKTLYEAGCRVQHLCYQLDDVDLLARLVEAADLADEKIWAMFVIGHYTGRVSHPDMIQPFIDRAAANGLELDWAVCAFAEQEHTTLERAALLGGKVRVGFENSIFMPDGSIAPDNETRVKAATRLFV